MWLDKPEKTRKIIVDVDAGTDDAWALFMLLRAMDAELCDIQAITCVNGNTTIDNVTRNVLRVLQTVEKERKIPVFKGCSEPLLGKDFDPPKKPMVHGGDGFGDLNLQESVDMSLLQSKHAVNAIADIVQANKKDIELVFVGPLTNLAVAIRMYGPAIVENIKAMWIMGGNHLGIGNITKSAEFNFFTDPEAAHVVLSSLSCPITIVPWETCTDRAGVTIPIQEWRMQELGSIDNKITRLMNAVDMKVYTEAKRIFFRPCDAFLTAVFLCPELVQVVDEWHASVELHGKHTRGQLVLDHLKSTTSNVRIVEKVNVELFKKILLWVVGHPDHVCIRCKE